MTIKVLNKSKNPLPKQATEGSAGMDLLANLAEDIILKPQENRLVPTGIHLELPQGFEAQIRPRSGLSKRQILVFLGTVDSDYRGEIFVSMMNLSQEEFKIENGLRIAQMVIAKYETVTLKESNELSETERGAGGFGSTGLK